MLTLGIQATDLENILQNKSCYFDTSEYFVPPPPKKKLSSYNFLRILKMILNNLQLVLNPQRQNL